MTATVFGNPAVTVEGWYWVLRAAALGRGQARAVTLMGRELAIFRGTDGTVTALDAHCPHMGAHLAEGRVEGSTLRCRFHGWRYDAGGRCVEVPSLGGGPPFPVAARRWPVAERYGLLWLWTGERPRTAVPAVPELEGGDVTAILGPRFSKPCHPHVVLVNAIDEHHFNTVHRMPVRLAMAATPVASHLIRFHNTEPPPDTRLGRLLRRLYGGPLTYAMAYAHGSTGTVTLGPDAWRFHLMFALRPTPEGGSEGQTVLLTRRRRGAGGAMASAASLLLTRLVSAYFARGDSRIFRTIRFDLRTPVRADHAVLAFIRHLETQPTVAWMTDDRRATAAPSPGAGPGLGAARAAAGRASPRVARALEVDG